MSQIPYIPKDKHRRLFIDIYNRLQGVSSGETTIIRESTTSSGGADHNHDGRYFRQSQLLSESLDDPQLRANIGLTIGTHVQAWSQDLDNYAANPLSVNELQQYQNLNSITINTIQWGYLGALDQSVRSDANVNFNTIVALGLIRGGSLRTDDGKIHAPVDLQLRNAGDTDYRSLSVKNLNASLDISAGQDLSSGRDLSVTRDGEVGRNLYVRGGLFATEFVVNQKRVRYDESMSVGGGKISAVSGSTGTEQIFFEDDDGNNFVPVEVDDILRIQKRTGFFGGAIIKSLYRRVSSISANEISLTTTGINWTTANDIGSIEVGDDVIVWGSTSDPQRNHRIDFNISGTDTPQSVVWDNVDDVDTGDRVLQWGGLENWGAESGIGFAVGDSSLAGNHILLTPNKSSLKFDSFDLKLPNIHIGNFDFGAMISSVLDGISTGELQANAMTLNGSTNTETEMTVQVAEANSVINADSLCYIIRRNYTNISGEWVRVQFDYTFGGADFEQLGEFAAGYSVFLVANGNVLQELSGDRHKNDTDDVTGSFDSGWFLVPEYLGNFYLQLTVTAPGGGLNSGDFIARHSLTNINVDVEDDSNAYVDIGNNGIRAYSSSGRSVFRFTPGVSEANFKNLAIGNYNFTMNEEGDLQLMYDDTLVETFIKP